MAPQGQCILDYGPQSGTPSLGLQCPGGKRPWEGQGLGRDKALRGKGRAGHQAAHGEGGSGGWHSLPSRHTSLVPLSEASSFLDQ